MHEPTDSALVAEGTEDEPKVSLATYLVDGGKVAAGAAAKVVSRIVGWAGVGFVSAQIAWAVLFFMGIWDDGIWGGAAISWFVMTAAGTAALGYAGYWRGIGAMVLYLALDKGLLPKLLDSTLGRVVERIARSPRFAGAIDTARGMETTWSTWREVTRTAIAERRSNALANVRRRGARGWVVKRFWRTVFGGLSTVTERVFSTEDGAARISAEAFRGSLTERVVEAFRDHVQGHQNRQLKLFGGLYVAVSLIVVLLTS